MKIKKEYALYKGDKFLDLGTAEELAKKFNVKKETIKFYCTNTYLKRIGKDYKNRLIAVKLEGDIECKDY